MMYKYKLFKAVSILSIFCISFLNIFAQDQFHNSDIGFVKYKVIKVDGFSEMILSFNNKTSKYIINNVVFEGQVRFMDSLLLSLSLPDNELAESSRNMLENNINKDSNNALFYDIENDYFFFFEVINKKKFKVLDKFNKIKWHLHAEYKLIQKFKCQKASCEFRGRNYEVWFSSEIPINLGPWKFNGLPGLILEVSSKDNALSIVVENISINKSITSYFNPNSFQKVSNYSTINILKYNSLLEQENKNILNTFSSKIKSTLSRENELISSNLIVMDSNLELNFNNVIEK